MGTMRLILIIALAIMAMVSPEILAADVGMPWEDPLNQITDSLTGPVARSVGLISTAITGFTLAMGEAGGLFRRLVQLLFGLSIAFSGATWVAGLFGSSSGALL